MKVLSGCNANQERFLISQQDHPYLCILSAKNRDNMDLPLELLLGSHVSDFPFEDRYLMRVDATSGEDNYRVLSAIQRIEHEMSYECNAYHSVYDNQNFHDQYRDMRMNIDDMSYEQLLALEDTMGTVSTALTEEALSKCLKISQYISGSTIFGGSGIFEHSKCNICQEEFADGDELGELVREHIYHKTYIHKWLRMKNWCSTCKASAVLSC